MRNHTYRIAICIAGTLLLLLSGCGIQVRKGLRTLHRDSSLTATISLPYKELEESQWHSHINSTPSSDTLKVVTPEGKEVFLMRSYMDSSGIIHITEPLDEVVITATVKNVAERNGQVGIAFDVNVPKSVLNPQWQVRLHPYAVILDDTVRLESVHITGIEYKNRQIKGYELYRRFLESIITDSTMLTDTDLLEIFIDRNFPDIASLKESNQVFDMDSIKGVYNITLQEARDYYVRQFIAKRIKKKEGLKGKKFRQYVKSPYVTDPLRLDTLITRDCESFTYHYKEDIRTLPQLKKIEILLTGNIYHEGQEIYSLPYSDPIIFNVSSFSTLTENIERYISKVIERRVEISAQAIINFHQGQYYIDEDLGNNRSEIEYIRSIISDIGASGEFVADSLIITASCSPEGTIRVNRILARNRAKAICDHFRNNELKFIEKHIPENWPRLADLVVEDTILTDKDYIYQVFSEKSLDKREDLLRRHPQYSYIRSTLYPVLREVQFDFHVHRKGMVKDTIHTTEIDTIYAAGIKAIQMREYSKAMKLLGPYRDINSAIALLAMDYNASAMKILEDLPSSGKRDYLLAISYSRHGNEKKAVEYFLSAAKLDRLMKFRGRLDPEISRLIDKYNLDKIFEEIN